jgi:hypothetical protein
MDEKQNLTLRMPKRQDRSKSHQLVHRGERPPVCAGPQNFTFSAALASSNSPKFLVSFVKHPEASIQVNKCFCFGSH